MIEEKAINYTSTGFKLLHHLDKLKAMQRYQRGFPVQAHLMPTSKCNLNCVFCSNRNRAPSELSLDLIKNTIMALKGMGLKAVEITGGGEPCIYPKINELLEFLFKEKLQVGLISNGTMIDKIQYSLLSQLIWIRISMNTLDYYPDWIPPDFPTQIVLGFSYVWNKLSSLGLFTKIKTFAEQRNARYVRIVPDCCNATEEVKKTNNFLKPVVERMGSLFFLQDKLHQKPHKCYLGYVKPCLYCDGYLYPCSSVVLNPDSENEFGEKYRICKLEKIKDFYANPVCDLSKKGNCTGCVFTLQNTFLDSLLHVPEHKDFP